MRKTSTLFDHVISAAKSGSLTGIVNIGDNAYTLFFITDAGETIDAFHFSLRGEERVEKILLCDVGDGDSIAAEITRNGIKIMKKGLSRKGVFRALGFQR